jgi:hypothetical protein
MEHEQNCKKWFELKTELGKNCTIDKFYSEGRPNICCTQAATKPEPVLTTNEICKQAVIRQNSVKSHTHSHHLLQSNLYSTLSDQDAPGRKNNLLMF